MIYLHNSDTSVVIAEIGVADLFDLTVEAYEEGLMGEVINPR